MYILPVYVYKHEKENKAVALSEELRLFLESNGLGEYFDQFVEDGATCKDDLVLFTSDDLLGYGMKKLRAILTQQCW